MTGVELAYTWWIAGAFYALAVLSALVPWVNAEALMLSSVPLAGCPTEVAALVALATLGQMTGKTVIYWTSRHSTRPRAPRVQATIDLWREHLRQRPRSALTVMLISSAVGLPPFYIVTIAAGVLNVTFARFLAVGTIGRLVHFGLLACVPHILWRSL